MPSSLKIVNARIVGDGAIAEGDVLVRGLRIEAVGKDLSGRPAGEVIDAGGAYLLPGMIDTHVHFRQPGAERAAEIRSESRAAVAGGITSYLEMPNTSPPTTTRARLEEKLSIAARDSMANYAFYLGASDDNLDELLAADPRHVCGIKVFFGASTGNLVVRRQRTLEEIFRGSPLTVVAHCEDTPTIERNEADCRSRLGGDPPLACHAEIRSAEACYLSSSRAVELARRYGTRLHILHISTARELELLEAGAPDGKLVTAEACVHHLWFCDEDYERLGTLIKCNPAIKTRADRDALREALAADRIDTVSTDHAPHPMEDKRKASLAAPSGIASVQHALPALIDLQRRGMISLERLVEKVCHAPARLFGIEDRGYVREGCFADLVLVDPDRSQTARSRDVLHKCGWSPYTGHEFSSTVAATLVAGRVAYRDGELDDRVRGLPLELGGRSG
ncbi:MAG: dihydroorotase [Polyangia bacterium]